MIETRRNSSDDKFGCINENFFYIYRINGEESLHKYKELDIRNEINKYPNKSKEMKKYVISMAQAAKWFITHNKTDLKNLKVLNRADCPTSKD